MNSGEAPDAAFQIHTIAVIGAGNAGRSFASLCVRCGFHVVLEDVMPANLRRAETEISTPVPGPGTLDLASTVEEAVHSADLAIDFVPDELESKLEIFSLLDRMAPPRTILCTPSDALSITDLASCVYRPERCVAVRGLSSAPLQVTLLHPPAASPSVISAVVAAFKRLSAAVSVAPDLSEPMLVKNLPAATP